MKDNSRNSFPQTLSGKRVSLYLNNAKTSTHKIEDFVKYHGGVVVIFLEKNVDMIIMDRTLQRTAPPIKRNYLTRSQQFLRKSIKQSGSSSIQLFASKWNIPVIDHSRILHVCKRAFFQEKEILLEHKRKLMAPFVKVEDQSRNFKPEFIEFDRFPFMDITVPSTQSPFQSWHQLYAKKNHVNEKVGQTYLCGLCDETYEVLKTHLDTNKHKVAAMDDSKYSRVDALIKRGLSWEDFVDNICKKRAKVNYWHDNMNWT